MVGNTPVALAGGSLGYINKSAVDKMVDKNEHVDTISVYSNVDYEVESKVN